MSSTWTWLFFFLYNVLVYHFFNLQARNQSLSEWDLFSVRNYCRAQEDPDVSHWLTWSRPSFSSETFGYTVLRTLKRSSAHTNTLEVSDRQNGIPFSRFKLIRILLLAVEKKQVVSRRSVSFPSASNPLLSNGVKEPSLWWSPAPALMSGDSRLRRQQPSFHKSSHLPWPYHSEGLRVAEAQS